MKATCKVELLAAACKAVAHNVTEKTPLPILACMKIEARNNTLTLTATDLETAIIATIDAQVSEAGVCAVPAKLLTECAATLPARHEILLSAGSGVLLVKSGVINTTLKVQDALEFPLVNLHESEWSEIARIDANVLKSTVKSVSFAASRDKNSPIFSGVYLHAQPERGTFNAVAADSFRMSHTSFDTQEDTPAVSLLIGARSFADLVSLLPDESVPAVLFVRSDASQVRIHIAGLDLVCRLISGAYPDYMQIGKIDPVCYVTVQVEALYEATRTALLFVDGIDNKQVTLRLEPSGVEAIDGAVTLEAQAADIGDYSRQIPAQIVGPALSFRFNARYVLEACRAISTDRVLISAASSSHAVIFEPVDGAHTRHVIMPLVSKVETPAKVPQQETVGVL